MSSKWTTGWSAGSSVYDAFVTTKFDRRVSLILASDDPAKNGTLGVPSSAWRCHHARLLSGLSAARASVVAFDMYFEHTVRLRSAVRRCDPAGIGLGHRGGRRCKGAAPHRRRDAGAGDRTSRARCRSGDEWGMTRRCSSAACRVGLAAPITQNAGLSLEGEVGVFPSLALRTLMHLEAQKRGGRPITAAVDRRRGLILLRDDSRSLARAIPVADEDMNMIVGVASRQEVRPRLVS